MWMELCGDFAPIGGRGLRMKGGPRPRKKGEQGRGVNLEFSAVQLAAWVPGVKLQRFQGISLIGFQPGR